MAGRIAVIVEGAKQEKKYFRSMERAFFSGMKLDIFILSGCENIYALWQQMSVDNFETDIIEILREKSCSAAIELNGISRRDFQEVYLFYDYDPQQDNGSNTNKMLEAMLKVFDNETENGKLYISYPMSEALRNITKNSCIPYTSCVLPISDVKKYKHRTGCGNKYVHVGTYKVSEWNMILSIYLCRLKCFYGLKKITDIFLNEKKLNSPLNVYREENKRVDNTGQIFILSAFPEFLVDYFPEQKIIEFAMIKNDTIESIIGCTTCEKSINLGLS